MWQFVRSTFCRIHVIIKSLTYNCHCDLSYAGDTLLEPLFWLIENYVRHLAPLFVGFLISMMGLVITSAYVVFVPYECMRLSLVEIVLHFVIGHWLLANVLFHYTMAWKTRKLNFAPATHLVTDVVTICKGCISPKPPRAHHCRICNRCILKMDHHCPFLNACVGHYNHRYFYLCMFFMWLSCCYIAAAGFRCFADHYWNTNDEVAPWCRVLNETLPYAPYACSRTILKKNLIAAAAEESDYWNRHQQSSGTQQQPSLSAYAGSGADRMNSTIERSRDNYSAPRRRVLLFGVCIYNSVLFVYFTAIAMVLGVGALLAWHTALISFGETSIEQQINRKTRQTFQKAGKVFINPYDLGWRKNWQVFLGLDDLRRNFWRHVCFPSSHRPTRDGLAWLSAVVENHLLGCVDVDSALLAA